MEWIKIISRRQWGAKYGEGWGFRDIPVDEVWFHHTVTNQLTEDASFEQDAKEVRYVESIGYKTFNYADAGWKSPAGSGISYTWVVTPSGRVFEGHNPKRSSSHTYGHNNSGVAIALVGNYENREPTKKQIDAVARLLLQAKEDGITTVSKLTGGHRDVFDTACPGTQGYRAIRVINNRVDELLGAPKDKPVTETKPETPAYYWANDHDYVVWVQESLKKMKYYTGGIDGSAGPMTRQAISRFQADYGLNADGEAGPMTKARIEEALVHFRVPAWWSDKPMVSWVQKSLITLGYYSGPVDGKGSDALELSIKKFQGDNNLTTDGQPGPLTKAAIDAGLHAFREALITETIKTLRIAGVDRWATARKLSKTTFPKGKGLVIAADGTVDFTIAATRIGPDARILPVRYGNDTPPMNIVKAIEELNPEWVRFVGGELAVTRSCARAILEVADLI